MATPGVDALINKLMSPEMMANFSRAIYYSIIPHMVMSFICLIIAGFGVRALFWYSKHWNELHYDDETFAVIKCIVWGFFVLISTIYFISYWLSPDSWMGIFDQKAYVASRILEKLSTAGK